jgi:hypothetical protein
MRYRNAALLCLSGMALLLGWWLGCFNPQPQAEITEENFRKLKKGMTRAEVEAIIGGPPGDYGRVNGGYHVHACESSTCAVFYNVRHDDKGPTAKEVDAIVAREGIAMWWGPSKAIAVQFDEDGNAVNLGYGGAMPGPSFWDVIREWEWAGW